MSVQKPWFVIVGLLLGSFVIVYLGRQFVTPDYLGERFVMSETPTVLETPEPAPRMAKATFGAGCFWCTEAVFQQLKGVQSVVSGYSGGSVKNPTYGQICAGTTGHAEAVQVTYDPAVISYEELLEVFWQTHDPTTRDRQGHDAGPQYRSVIFYHTDAQHQLAEHYKKQLDASGAFPRPIVTEIVPFTEFYRAEAYHQNYYAEHSGLLANRQLIAHVGRAFFRHLIGHLQGRQNRHFWRAICRFCTSSSAHVDHGPPPVERLLSAVFHKNRREITTLRVSLLSPLGPQRAVGSPVGSPLVPRFAVGTDTNLSDPLSVPDTES